MSYPQNLAQLFWRAVEDPELLQSIRRHKRYNFRLIAILSNQLGLFLNLLAVCLVRNKVLNGLAFLPLCISLLWSVSDLMSNRIFKHGMPLRLIAWVDLLGFVSFLVFLIINGNLPGCFASMGPFLRLSKYTLLDLKMLIPYLPGIVGSKQRDSGLGMLLAYTSVPWMFCCVIHGLVVAQFVLPYPFGNLHLNAQVCPDCHRDWESHGGTAGNRKDETYALLHDGEDNVSRGGTGSKITDGETTARTQRPQEDV